MDKLTSQSVEIPPLELFYLGGSTSMRGWGDGLYGATGNETEGGVIKLLVNCELRIPLKGILGVNLFADGGILAKDASDFEDQWNAWFGGQGWDAGLELSIATPLGPVRISYAVRLSRPEEPHFSLGLMNAF
jgi:outer membrane protein insertion porin family